ncbi:MAG: hypothetical protein E6Q89_09575 [Bacteroidia bacterium]|nr:MAG: hypothetical protein E6Q89_09575 [Bacteroidia bacterium]
MSSHHPYYIPPNYKDKVKRGSQPICASINYGDHALRLFFNEAKKQKWYKNTLFVLVADHTPASTTAEYNQKTMMYRIPILFFDPGNRLPKEMIAEIFQQIDIMPTSFYFVFIIWRNVIRMMRRNGE